MLKGDANSFTCWKDRNEEQRQNRHIRQIFVHTWVEWFGFILKVKEEQENLQKHGSESKQINFTNLLQQRMQPS